MKVYTLGKKKCFGEEVEGRHLEPSTIYSSPIFHPHPKWMTSIHKQKDCRKNIHIFLSVDRVHCDNSFKQVWYIYLWYLRLHMTFYSLIYVQYDTMFHKCYTAQLIKMKSLPSSHIIIISYHPDMVLEYLWNKQGQLEKLLSMTERLTLINTHLTT